MILYKLIVASYYDNILHVWSDMHNITVVNNHHCIGYFVVGKPLI